MGSEVLTPRSTGRSEDGTPGKLQVNPPMSIIESIELINKENGRVIKASHHPTKNIGKKPEANKKQEKIISKTPANFSTIKNEASRNPMLYKTS